MFPCVRNRDRTGADRRPQKPMHMGVRFASIGSTQRERTCPGCRAVPRGTSHLFSRARYLPYTACEIERSRLDCNLFSRRPLRRVPVPKSLRRRQQSERSRAMGRNASAIKRQAQGVDGAAAEARCAASLLKKPLSIIGVQVKVCGCVLARHIERRGASDAVPQRSLDADCAA